jgi:hypothetical protein
MKKFLIRSLRFVGFFLIFFILFNALYLAFLTQTSFNVKNRLTSLRFNKPDYDILVLGASTTSDGVDTELLTRSGFKSYNMAIGGSNVRTSFIQFQEYLERYDQKPEYVLLGVNSILEKDFDKGDVHPIVEVTMKDHKFTIEDIPISKFRWLAFEVAKMLVSKEHRKAELVQGQIRSGKTVGDYTGFRDQYLDLELFKSSVWLGQFASVCHQNGIKLFVIEMPGYRDTQNLSEYGPITITLDNNFTANVYNFNTRQIAEAFDPDLDWVGNSHLNQRGAVKFTNMLIDSLLIDLQ